jgi:hypothetical protein
MSTCTRVLLTQALIGAVLAMSGQAAMAQAGVGPCSPDVQKFCKGVQPGQGRIRECLKGHLGDLSAECKQHVESGQSRRQGAPAARPRGNPTRGEVCKADLEKHCKDVKQGEGRLLACLRSHESELTPECKAQIGGAPAKPAAPATPAKP